MQLLDRSDPRPIYQQIKERLREMAARSKPGEKLFTDGELANLFGVNRLTVRQAVQELVHEGFLYRVRGVGTFLRPVQLRGQVTGLERFFQEWGLQGYDTTVELTAFEPRPCPLPAALLLGLQPGEIITYVGRVRYVHGTAVAVDHRYLPMAFGTHLKREELSTRLIFEVIQERCGVPAVRARNELQAVGAPAEEARLLRIPVGTPVMQRRGTAYTHQNQPFMATVSIYRGDLFAYTFEVPSGEHRVHVESSTT